MVAEDIPTWEEERPGDLLHLVLARYGLNVSSKIHVQPGTHGWYL
jgi:hypothetical protein